MAETKVDVKTTEQELEANTEFFPWLEAGEEQQKLFTKIRRFPLIGGLALIGSALTVFFSWLVLFLFEGKNVIPKGSHMPKPAAWLSVIGSLNSILLHVAVQQGLNVSWWFRASKKQTTVAELHENWS